jgi:hypothetical protein
MIFSLDDQIRWLYLYRKSKYNEITREFMLKMVYFYENRILYLDFSVCRDEIYRLLLTYMNIYVMYNFEVNEDTNWRMIRLNYIIYTLARYTGFKMWNYIDMMIKNGSNRNKNNIEYRRLLPFLSPLYEEIHKLELNLYKNIFNYDRYWGSYWYDICTQYMFEVRNSIESDRKLVIRHIDEFMDIDTYFPMHVFVYFYTTYLDEERNKRVREKINNIIQNETCISQLQQNHNKNKRRDKDRLRMAVIGKNDILSRTHPVFKYYYNQIVELKKRFHMTLILLENEIDSKSLETIKDYDLYDEYYTLKIVRDVNTIDGMREYVELMKNGKDNLLKKREVRRIIEGEYDVIYYPTVGDSMESIIMSNIRGGRVQYSSYGHPVSTYGSRNTHIIGSKEAETERTEKMCTEKIEYISDITTEPIIPEKITKEEYEEKLLNKGNKLINLGWNYKKITPKSLELIKNIIKENSEIKFDLHIGPCGNLPMHMNHVIEILERYEIRGSINIVPAILSREEYERRKGRGKIGIDSNGVYGGYTTILESIQKNVPVIVKEGEERESMAYTKLPGVIMRKYGLEELIVRDEKEMIEKIKKLINEEEYYKFIMDKIFKLNIKIENKKKNYGLEMVHILEKLLL